MVLDYQSYARPLRLLPAEEVKVSIAKNPSLTVAKSQSLYMVKLQTSNVFGSGISDMNARVLLCLIDDKGDSLLQTIPATLSSNDESFKFQRGSVDEFTFLGPELGKIRAFWISLESGQLLFTWKLISLDFTDESCVVLFSCFRTMETWRSELVGC